jgi:bis(5'-nucleosyl)-tetraphosphatase (symmetrical)
VSDYVIGDVQGCYEPLQRLLKQIQFEPQKDCLWFVGDLVNRGPDSLKVLRFLKQLPIPPKIALGNHDLHLLVSLFGQTHWQSEEDTILQVLEAPDAQELGHWLRQQSMICYSESLQVLVCHAGIAPQWTLQEALYLAREVEEVLQGEGYQNFLNDLYGDKPDRWDPALSGTARLRCITNYLTRMRFCDHEGRLNFSYKGGISTAPSTLYPWYEVPARKVLPVDLVFGHWASLKEVCPAPHLYAIDTGCFWGGELTALRLQDRQRFSVAGILR